MRLSFTRLPGREPKLPPVPLERETLLQGVTEALIAGHLDPAEQTLRIVLDNDPTDAAALNLLGALYELRGDWKNARKQYGLSIKADRHYEPAQQNMRRWYELFTFGRTRELLALHEAVHFVDQSF